ncbi:Na+/H+ antiporter NhaC family protein [Clostridium transplantifaecale]|uniref:Na+/H+ antiporter NhaC family protein n=1 Tax=Clostridium transplantifaecale TaxID=2479838 RepID=UPI000F639C95|nr:Na+/H+ antiporter NhaC family protein [Clostridium transplantifaecale]
MGFGILSCIPIVVLLVGATITRKMPEMLLLSSFIGAVILYGKGFFTGYINIMYEALANGSFQFILLILVGSGALIALLEKSGAMLGFRNMIRKAASTKDRALLFTWILGVIVFIDDYLNALAVSSAMKNITDEYKVPREHLAYTVNCTGSCVCVLIPFSSWAAFGIGVFKDYGLEFSDYVKALPFMFYPIVALIICLLFGYELLPKLGGMKEAYDRVAAGGSTLVPSDEARAEETDGAVPSSPINFLLPMLVLIVTMILCDNELIHGLLAALVAQAVLYIGQKIMSPKEFIETAFNGIYSMASVSFVVALAFMMTAVNTNLGFSEYMIDILGALIPATVLPVIAFLLVAFIAFASGSFWPLVVIVAPIFVPMALNFGMNPSLIIAAIMSGIAFGSQFCFYSDAVFMTAAGTGVPNVNQIKAIAPYVLSGAVIAAVLFTIAGFIG